ncbi:SRPBCC family protein [Rugosimonospora africana]|uniref:SRPBCC family protein n=1 Tax=Rugosimonospora africana TaxID=556532 RepID=UPI001943E60B|nr:SRPBCC domain-containing protein [Rugosimonospora africana]
MPLTKLETSTNVSVTWRIESPPSRVWACLTDAHLLSQWLGDLVEGAVRPGAVFVIDHGGDYRCRSTVVEHAEPEALAFTWSFPDEPDSEVLFDLYGTLDATQLSLRHKGLGDLAASYRDGWCVHLSYLEAAALGAPLPRAMFWCLHGTISQLNVR